MLSTIIALHKWEKRGGASRAGYVIWDAASDIVSKPVVTNEGRSNG